MRSPKIFNEVRFELTAGGHQFNVIDFTIDEGFSTPFCGEFKLSNKQRFIHAEDMLNKTCTLKIYQNKTLTRLFSGIIQRFEKGDDTGHETRYNLTIVPAFARFSLRHESRIFQHKSVVNILEVMLKEMRISHYSLRMMNTHAPRDYCVQYRESDLAFLHRILAEEGISYFFEYSEDKHTIIFNDYTPRANNVGVEILYDPSASAMPEHPYIRQFLLQNEIKPTKAVLQDYHFRSPRFTLSNQEIGYEMESQNGDYEHYDYPSRYSFGDNNIGRLFTKARINYLRRDAITALGKGNIAEFIPGFYFELKEQYLEAYNRTWILTHVRHRGTQPQSLEERSSEGAATYYNDFSVMPKDIPWSSTPDPKPQVGGPHVAVVTGPPGEEIYVDEYGRVKVRFKWDRKQTPEPSNDSERTCWLRVSDGWAGAGRGMIALPRVGDEVLVSFLEGDPDQPIITGRTYHSHNRHPYSMPKHKTITGIRTKTHRGEGYNELYFDDENEKQLVRIHAEKDYDLKVKNVKNERIDFDHQVSIGNDERIDIANDRTITVEGEQHYTTKGAHIELREADSSLEIKGDLIEKVAGTHGLRVDGDLTLESKSRLTLKVGGNFVVIDSSGVYIKGPIVTVNSGGTPGDTVVPQVPTILDTAVGEGSAFVASCPLQDTANKSADFAALLESMGIENGEGGANANLRGATNTASSLANLAKNPSSVLGLAGQLTGATELKSLANTANLANRVLTDSLGMIDLAKTLKDNPENLAGLLGILGENSDGSHTRLSNNVGASSLATPEFNPHARS
ncbi:type VI secretion system tip protein TssI/VgrG [Ignatzschineria larvae DSM 13226]|uniref:Type VI secretion system tip protein TssI/VgrG n=1 Tax=Ignatzschineria larvae DSM 13226 TaxID=1111732 RepID=A0ABZ3C1B2_9GAMM|nr:type VI secretion system tip protein TssI/VgrG [Ignatzschineria larvae]